MSNRRFSSEQVLFALIVLLSILIGVINPTFFSFANLLDIFRSSTINGIFAIGVLFVIISGGIDISFPAIAAFSMYATAKILNGFSYNGSFILPMMISAIIGFCLGSFNALLISKFNLPTLIVTIGTANLFNGILLTFIGSQAIMKLPSSYNVFAKTNLVTAQAVYGTSSIPIAFLVWMFVSIFAIYILKFTILGRSIYAIGGNKISAKRIGVNIGLTQLFIYGASGAIAGLAGTVNTAMKRTCNPFDVIGIEMMIIAAVVLGGTKITGGKGSVVGTILGVIIFTIINNSLIMVGISTYWQRAVIGFLIIISTSITAQQRGLGRSLNIRKLPNARTKK